MAEPLSDHIYLPPLEPCLKGEAVILSWRLLAEALLDPTGHRQDSRVVVDFLTDPLVQTFFTKPGSAFERPADKSPHHAAFVKKTAAIQVTPDPNDKYDINVIKEDALWLSDKAPISNVAALRVVAVEFQSRAKSQLAGPISNQDLANLREAAGAANTQSTHILPGINIASALDASEIQADFEKPESRRRRIFQTYLDERRYYAAAHDYLFTLMLQERLPVSPLTDAARTVRTSFLEAYGMSPKQPQKSPADTPTRTFHALVTQFINLLRECVERLEMLVDHEPTDKELWTEEVRVQWIQTYLAEALHRLVVIFQLLDLSSDVFVSSQLAQQWFSVFHFFGFFDQFQGGPDSISELLSPLQCLVCVVSLAILNLPRMTAFFEGEVDLDTDAEYLASSNTLESIHDILELTVSSGSAYAVPVMFAWIPAVYAMFSSYQERVERRDAIQNEKAVENYDPTTQMIPRGGRRNSAGSITTIDKRRYDDFLVKKSLDRDFQKVQSLAVLVTGQARVYDIITAMSLCLGPSDRAMFPASVGSRMRATFLELLKASYPFVGYKSEPVCALLAVLSGGQGYWDLARPTNVLAQQDILNLTLNDDIILQRYFEQALNRFPYEFIPLLSFCRILYCSPHSSEEGNHEFILRLLQRTPTLTFTLPDHFNDYQLANEQDNANGFQFLDDFPLLSAVTSRKRIAADEESFTIPAGTYGRFVVDEGKIVRVEHEHSALALLGKRLDANLAANKYQMTLGRLTEEETAETISLFATLIRMEHLRASAPGKSSAETSEVALAIVAECSRGLPRTKDIISVVCDTLDVLLDGEPDGPGLATITASLQFLHSILPICPGRVWSYMARCTLLDNQGQGGRLARLVGNLDLSDAQFEFLMSTVRLSSSLIQSAMTSSVRRKTNLKTSSRQRSNDDAWIGVSDKVVSQISLSIVRAAMDVLESSSTWRFSTDLDRMVLIRSVVPIVDQVILYTFSIDDITSKTFLMSSLEPAAKDVIDNFLAPTAGSLRIHPLLATLVAATQQQASTIYANRSEVFLAQTIAVLGFAKNLVRVANYFDRPSTTVEHQLFKATPFVARVCACHDAFKGPAIELLEALVISAGKTVGEPPSLLGYLGPQLSRSFLQLLSTLDKPFDQTDEVRLIWRFFSTIVRNRQQWMANCLLTGKTPRDAKNSRGKATEASSGSILSSALEQLTSISQIQYAEAVSILNFITSAQNYWPWTIFTLQKNTAFLAELRSFVRSLNPSSVTAKSDEKQACNEAQIAAYIAEIFAMQLFHLRQIDGASSFANELTHDLDYYLRDGVAVSGYNRGLHVNFARNFSNQYPGYSLDNFKRNLLEPRTIGVEYYALDFADEMLGFDSGWVGPKNNGFRSEMEKANANLSLVDAQVSLYHAWEFLLLELSTCLPNNDTLKKQSLQVAEQCLEANQETQSHDQVFERLAESRVNLALMLVQRVVDSAPSAGDVAQLLTALWATVSSVQEPYAPGNISRYRTLLKLLYVTLRAQVRSYAQTGLPSPHSDRQGANTSAAVVSQTVLNIIETTVARGFRTLVSLVHDSEASVSPHDVALINAILQACLCIPGMDQNQTQILNIMAAHDAVQAAVSLYSWSDKLADQGDPVYGELSLLFLLELSALPSVAEQLACDGLLNRITSANLAAYLRRPNVSPLADSVGPQRCYSIWAKGIVPLLLNILTALGATIAPEIAYVLNQFPNLMESSVERFEAPDDSRRRGRSDRSFITHLSVSEIHSLVLMTRVLGALRVNNARDIPPVEWDSGALLETVEFWIDRRKLLRERLVPLGPREAEWKNMPPTERNRTRGFESRLEEKVVEQLEQVRIVLTEGLE